MFRSRSMVSLVAALAILCAPACSPPAASAAPVPTIARDVSPPAAADSLTYVLRWGSVSDANGAATSYVDTVKAGTQVVRAHAGTATLDTVRVAAPAIGSSVTFVACVRAIRRGLSSAPGCVSWIASTADVAPPPPQPSIDSSAVPVAGFLSSAGAPAGALAIAAGDSAMVTEHLIYANGDTLVARSAVVWHTGDSTVAIPHPVAGTANAWIVVPITASSALRPTGGVLVMALSGWKRHA